MSLNKQIKQVVNQAVSQGWELGYTSKNHYKLTRPGCRPVFTSRTPSKPSSVANFRAQLKRNEVAIA